MVSYKMAKHGARKRESRNLFGLGRTRSATPGPKLSSPPPEGRAPTRAKVDDDPFGKGGLGKMGDQYAKARTKKNWGKVRASLQKGGRRRRKSKKRKPTKRRTSKKRRSRTRRRRR